MSNKANNDKSSIKHDIENFLDIFEPAFANLPKAMQMHGAAVRLEQAAYELMANLSIALRLGSDEFDRPRKLHYIEMMIGNYGVMDSCFKRVCQQKVNTQKRSGAESVGEMHLFADKTLLNLARCMERVEVGISKWRNYLKSHSVKPAGRSAEMQETPQQNVLK